MNYLRVRGEYQSISQTGGFWVELPPRARRILQIQLRGQGGGRTTSACAENTEWRVMYVENERNYLRVRGEYAEAKGAKVSTAELPPRARRIHNG